MSFFGGGGGSHPKPDHPPTPAPPVPAVNTTDKVALGRLQTAYKQAAQTSYSRYLLTPSGDVRRQPRPVSYAAGLFSSTARP